MNITLLPTLCIGVLSMLLSAAPGFAADQPLPPDEAFRFNASLKDKDTVVATIIVAKKHYLYKNKTRFALKNSSGVAIKDVVMPVGEMKNDPLFGNVEVFKVPISVTIPLERSPKAKGFTLYATYQGCNEVIGLCYPPIEKTMEISFPDRR
jgi:thiol:disulfide interchange protein